MEEGNKKQPTLKEMTEYFESIDLPRKPFPLTKAVQVNDVSKTIKSLTDTLKANSGKRSALPYYHTLLLIYKHLKNEFNK